MDKKRGLYWSLPLDLRKFIWRRHLGECSRFFLLLSLHRSPFIARMRATSKWVYDAAAEGVERFIDLGMLMYSATVNIKDLVRLLIENHHNALAILYAEKNQLELFQPAFVRAVVDSENAEILRYCLTTIDRAVTFGYTASVNFALRNIMSYLPKCRDAKLWDVMQSWTVIEYSESIVMHGRLDVLRRYNVNVNGLHCLSSLCFHQTEDRLPLLQWLRNHGGEWKNNQLSALLPVLLDRNMVNIPQLAWALDNGIVNDVQDKYRLRDVCRGHLQLFKYLVERNAIAVTPKYASSCAQRFPKTLSIWALDFVESPKALLRGATLGQRLRLVSWLDKNNLLRRKKRHKAC